MSRSEKFAQIVWTLFNEHGSDGLYTQALLRGNEVFVHLVGEVDHPSDLNNRVFKLKIVEIPPSKFKPYGLCWLAGVLSWIKKNGSKII